MIGATLANGPSSIAKRSEADFYPTPPECTKALMDFLQIPKELTVWEPACGDGDMSKIIEHYGHSVFSTDLREDTYGIGGIDFLTYEYSADVIITNPPFKLSVEFIYASMQKSDKLFALLLKSQYWHAKSRTSLFNMLPPSYVLPLNWRPDFTRGERGGSPTMDVMWVVWEKGKYDTRYRILEKPCA